MGSNSRPRKRSSEDQLDRPIENFEPDYNKRSKGCLACISEPVAAGNPSLTSRLPRLALLSGARALDVSDHDVDLLEIQSKNSFRMTGQTRREKEERSDTISHDSSIGQDSQTSDNGNTDRGLAINFHNSFAVPTTTTQEVRGREPGRPVVRMSQDGYYPPGGGNHALQDYQMQLMLLEHQNKKRMLMAMQEMDAQVNALQKITSLPDQLHTVHTSVKELLENLPVYLQNIQDFNRQISTDIKAVQDYERDLNVKKAEIDALENVSNDMIQMTPGAHRAELRQVKEKAMLMMQEDWEKLKVKRDDLKGKIEAKNEKIARSERALARARELVPELIEDLRKLAPKLAEG